MLALPIAVLLLCLKTSNKLLNLPGKLIQPVLHKLQPLVAPGMHAAVAQLHAAVVEVLKAQSTKYDESIVAQSSAVKELMRSLGAGER